MVTALNGPPARKSEADSVRDALNRILADLLAAPALSEAEAALTAVAELLDMPKACWVPDTSHPYELPGIVAYSRSRGWSDELLRLFWDRHASLKMPFYIRCRFEHLPFVVSLDQKRHCNPDRVTPEESQITALVRDLGVSTLLVVPLHLAKGQVAMVTWAGARQASDLVDLMPDIEGSLLAIGLHFMRLAAQSLQASVKVRDELSSLTRREWDCARTLAQGYREAEIAELIGIKKGTVRFHLDKIVRKFGCKTRGQAVAMLAQLGLLGPIGI
jgi:DNA-binding CsgD family transcriptional regulator